MEKNIKWSTDKLLHGWLIKVLELISLILLLIEFIPKDIMDKGKETGLSAIIFLGVISISLLITNYIIFKDFRVRTEILEKSKIEAINDLNTKMAVLKRRAVYSDCYDMLNQVFRQLHENVRNSSSEESKYKEIFSEYCNVIAKIFEKITGVETHVCIKICVSSNKRKTFENNIHLKTYVRSTSIINRNIADNNNITHYVNDNTDFEFVFKNGKTFFSNDLRRLVTYKNSSSKKKNTDNSIVYSMGKFEDIRDKWPLPYLSVICCPIVSNINNIENESILGFLCVDLPNEDLLIEEIDTKILEGCSEGLFNTFKTFLEITTKKK